MVFPMSGLPKNVLSITEVTKSFGDHAILDELTFGLAQGDVCGIIGANGTGKSTLLKIMAQEESCDQGTVAVRKDQVVAYLSQTTTLPEGTVGDVLAGCFDDVREAISGYEEAAVNQDPSADALLARIDSLGGWDWEHKLERAASLLSLTDFLNESTSRLSGGESKRVALARLLLIDADIVLLDEPTNHLDAETVEWLERWISESSKTFIVITHDRYFLDHAVSQISELREGKLFSYPGGFTDYLVARAEEEELKKRTTQRTYNILRVQLEWASRSPSARRTKAKAKLKDIEERTQKYKKLSQGQHETTIAFADVERLGKTILEMHGISKSFEEDKPLIKDFYYFLKKRSRIGVLGPNGSGKSTLLKLLTGELECDSGRIEWGKNSRVAMLDQHRSVLDPKARLKDIVAPDGRDVVFVGGKEKVHIASYLDRFGFPTSKHKVLVSTLSGGERNRLALARFLLEDANIILLDEPTNDLDLPTIHILEQALLTYPGCIITVSHDRYFLDRLATTIIAFEPDTGKAGDITVIEGDYTTYKRIRLEEIKRAKREAVPLPKKEKPTKAKTKGLSYNEQREFEGLEPAIEALEASVSELEEQLAAPDLWASDTDAALALQNTLEATQSELSTKMRRWEELMLRVEESP
jgi:ATP-binding cassette subfamily F protein uup